MADGPTNIRSKTKKTEQVDTSVNARGRIAWKDEEQTRRNQEMWDTEPDKPAVLTRLPNFTGEWMCSSVTDCKDMGT